MKKGLSEFIFWISGWKVVGKREFPDKCLVIAAPHTSNWDFLVGRCFAYIIGITPKYLIKSELFLPILGVLIKCNGGIPVYRNSKNNIVDQIVELYNTKKKFIIGISPEGTRRKIDSWKTGFYHIAIAAQVPVVTIGLDFNRKTLVIAPPLEISGNLEKDMPAILNFFRSIKGRRPKAIPDFN